MSWKVKAGDDLCNHNVAERAETTQPWCNCECVLLAQSGKSKLFLQFFPNEFGDREFSQVNSCRSRFSPGKMWCLEQCLQSQSPFNCIYISPGKMWRLEQCLQSQPPFDCIYISPQSLCKIISRTGQTADLNGDVINVTTSTSMPLMLALISAVTLRLQYRLCSLSW